MFATRFSNPILRNRELEEVMAAEKQTSVGKKTKAGSKVKTQVEAKNTATSATGASPEKQNTGKSVAEKTMAVDAHGNKTKPKSVAKIKSSVKGQPKHWQENGCPRLPGKAGRSKKHPKQRPQRHEKCRQKQILDKLRSNRTSPGKKKRT